MTTTLGPLEAVLQDPAVMEIMINGHDAIFVERHGRLERVDARFDDEAHLLAVIDAILNPYGLHLTTANPMVDVRLSDGSRMFVVGRPVAALGPTVTIRKFMRDLPTLEDLLRYGSLSADIITFLRACVEARLNVVVAGGTGAGKTTVMNALCQFIDPAERIIVVETATEIQLNVPHIVRLETRLPDAGGYGEVTMRQLVEAATRMRPDRILFGEVHGGAAFNILEAVNDGHDGSMLTMHAGSLRDVLTRLEINVTEGNPNLPLMGVRELIASTVQIVTYQSRLSDGGRRLTNVAEVVGIEGSAISVKDIFVFEQTGEENGRIQGRFVPTGYVPRCLPRLKGIDAALFTA